MNIKEKKFSGKCLIDIFLTKNMYIRESLTKPEIISVVKFNLEVKSILLCSNGRRKWQPALVFLPGEFLWTEEPGRLQSMGSQELDVTW